MGSPSPDRLCLAIAKRQYGLIRRLQALRSGLSPDQIDYRIEVGRWIIVHPEVYAIGGTPSSWHQEVLAACFWARDGLASHRSAATLWGLTGFDSALPIDITSTRCHLPSRSGLRVHHTNRLLAKDRVERHAIPVTSIERTLLDIGAVAPPHRVAIAFDSALRQRLTSTARLDEYLRLTARRGRRGVQTLRSLVKSRSELEALPESALETLFLDIVRDSDLPMPELQFEIRDSARFVARVDFAWPEKKVALEMDGFEFHSGRENWERDRSRRNRITALGWSVLHGTWREIRRSPDEILMRIANALGLAA